MGRKRIYFSPEEKQAGKRASNMRRYYAEPERARQIRRDWYHRNKEKLRETWRLRDRRYRLAEGCHSTEDVERILAAQKGKCAICRVMLKNVYHKDHIIPLSSGGSNWPSNLQMLCPTCNMRKGSKDPIDYMQSLGLLI